MHSISWEVVDDDGTEGDGVHAEEAQQSHVVMVTTAGVLRERRRCRDDGKVYTFPELVRRYSSEYPVKDLQDYWRDCCQPLDAEQMALAHDNHQAEVRRLHFEADMAQRHANMQSAYLVSLGGWCGPKLAFRQLSNLDGPSLPWDWGRSTMDHIIFTLQTDFTHFMLTNERLETKWASQGMCHPHGVICTTPGHTFWHHDLFDPKDRQVLLRRIERFRHLGRFSPLLFVRAVITTMELRCAELLLNLLRNRFGEQVYLLLLVDWQVERRTITFEEPQALLVHTVKDGSTSQRKHNSIVYCAPIVDALQYARFRMHPGPCVMLKTVADLFDSRRNLVRHASFGESLTDPMAYEPVMPPSSAIRRALAGDELDREIVRKQIENARALEAR